MKDRIKALEKEVEMHLQNEQALRASEKIYRRIVENVNTGILIAQDGKLVFVNPGISKFLGYTRDELLAHPNPFEFIHPDDAKFVFERHMRRQQGEKVPDVYPYRVITKEGLVKWVEVTGVQILWGERPATLNSFIDITKEKQANLALQHSEERYRSLVENTMDGYFIIEASSGKFLFINQRARDMFGYSMQEGLETFLWDVIAPEEHPVARQRLKSRIDKSNTSSDTMIYSMIRKDGATFMAEVSSSLVTYEGRLVIQGTIKDITEKEALQNQLYQVQRLESIGTLAGGLAHDFNNILMGIQGRISLMMNADTSHPDYEHLKAIEEFIKRAVHLTKQLLDFARGGKYEVLPININQLINDSAQLFGHTKKEIQIHTQFEKELWTVEGDRRQIEQVLLNLFVNAWQAMPGGGELYLKTENFIVDENHLKPYHAEPGKYVKMSITDTGIGIDKALQQKIFDPFFTTKEGGKGTGLGLASAYGIIKNHGGFINVYSEKGQGTAFTIYLPASEKAVIHTKKQPMDIPKGNETIMLVDDEAFVTEIGKDMLESLGYNVLVAGSGASALELYRNNVDKIDMVILDMIMPRMNGAQVFKHLRKINPELKVLLCSGYSLNGDAADMLDQGCNGFIQKPFSVIQLSQKVREILDEPRGR